MNTHVFSMKNVILMEVDFTRKQGQYLVFIYYYVKLNKRSPAFSDFGKYFEDSPASVNSMIKKLEEKGLIRKEVGKPRSIELLLEKKELPELE